MTEHGSRAPVVGERPDQQRGEPGDGADVTGPGSAFTVEFPGIRVLIVEDDDDARALVAKGGSKCS
jgi:hypothetical protein